MSSEPRGERDDHQGGTRRTPDESRALIVSAAREALADVGMGELTVGAVMDRTPLGRSSFYLYFDDLDALLLGLLQDNVALFAEPASTWLEDPNPDTVRVAMRDIVETWADNRGWWGELINSAMVPRKELGANWRRTEVDNWAPILAEHFPDDGPGVRAGTSIGPLARAYVLMMFAVLGDASASDDVDLDELTDLLTASALALFYGTTGQA